MRGAIAIAPTIAVFFGVWLAIRLVIRTAVEVLVINHPQGQAANRVALGR